MAELSYIDRLYDRVVRGMPDEELNAVAQQAQPQPQIMPQRDVATEAILSFGPAVLAGLTGETGAVSAPAAAKQSRDLYESQRKEEGAYLTKVREAEVKRSEREAKQKQLDVDNKRQDELLNLRKEEVDIKKKDAANPSKEPELNAATDLRKEFNARPETKRFSEVSTAFDKVQKAAENPSAAGDLSLIFGYMKMLDPGSTVREGEFANAQNAAGVPDKILNLYNRAKSGERLNPEQRKQFIASAQQAYEAELTARQGIESEFGGLAQRYRVDPNLVFSPAKKVQSKPQTKEINGVTYVKVEGGWQAQ